MAKTAVVILNWNGAEMLRRFLPSVVKNTPEADIIVADNGSTDNSIAILKEEFEGVQIIPLGNNFGFAEGYNRALQQIDAEYCVLLNSDVMVEAGWINPLLQYMDNHPNVAAVQPKILSLNHPTQFEHAGAAGGEMDILGYPYALGRIMDYVEEDYDQYNTAHTCFWASGACMLIRTHLYREAGGLDADYFAHMEEIDLCWRLQCRGYQIAAEPASKVYHLGGGSLQYGSPRKTYLNFRNNLITLWKNLPTTHLIWVLPIRMMMDYAAALNDLLHGRSDNAWAIVKARFAVYGMMRSTLSKRKENQQHTVLPYPTTIRNRSIVWDYYIRGKRQ